MKKLLYCFIVLGVIYFFLAFFAPSEIKIERSVFLEQSKSLVMEKLTDFKYFHENWNPWTSGADSNMLFSYKGEAGKEGHIYTWSGNKSLGKGQLEITWINSDSIYQRFSFKDKGDAKSYLIVRDSAQGSFVSWGMIIPVGFLGRTPLLFMKNDKVLGNDYERGLKKLKESLDENFPAFKINTYDWEACTYVGRKQSIALDQLNVFFENNFGHLEMVLEKQNIKTLSSPCALYFSYDEENQSADVSCAYKVPNGTKLKDWESFVFPACKVLAVEYKGYPSGSGDAHKAINDYMRSKTYEYQMVIEEFVKGPDENDECYGCVTMVYYLLK